MFPFVFPPLWHRIVPWSCWGAWTRSCGGHTLLSSWNQLLQHMQGVTGSPKSPWAAPQGRLALPEPVLVPPWLFPEEGKGVFFAKKPGLVLLEV